jgi:hypothetical protein
MSSVRMPVGPIGNHIQSATLRQYALGHAYKEGDSRLSHSPMNKAIR